MAGKSNKKGLGRGLSDLFEQNTAEDGAGIVTLRLSEIEPNRSQPRKVFDEAAIAELAESISKHGIIQPLLVRPIPGGGYQIVAGERRFRASRMAGISEVPVVIKELSDMETMEIALIENLQREDLNPVEEAQGYKQLMDTYEMTQEEVSKTVGKSRPVIANALRLLNLPDYILEKLSTGSITSGQARALLAFKDEEKQRIAAQLAENGQATVRDLEKMAKMQVKESKTPPSTEKEVTIPFYKEAEIAMSEYLGRKVTVKNDSRNKGTLTVEFYGEDDLKELLKIFEKE